MGLITMIYFLIFLLVGLAFAEQIVDLNEIVMTDHDYRLEQVYYPTKSELEAMERDPAEVINQNK